MGEKTITVNRAPVLTLWAKAFGDDLGEVRSAMEELAGAFEPEDLEERAFGLYEDFRPEVPKGKRDWGAKGDLDLSAIRSLKPSGEDS